MHPAEGNKAGERAGRNVLWGVAEGFRLVWFGGKGAEGQPHCSLQLPEEGTWGRSCWALLPGTQWQDTWEWFKAAPGEVQTGNREAFLYWKGGQTLEKASWRGGRSPKAVCLRGIATMLLTTCFNFWSALKWSGGWTTWSL